MKFIFCSLFLAINSFCLFAHPMGNFSINHYAKIALLPKDVELTYILDFAEIPTSELFNQWGCKSASDPNFQQNVRQQAALWAKALIVTLDSQALPARWSKVEASTLDGAGGMPVLRVVMTAHLGSLAHTNLTFKDKNFPDRTGWKEVVIEHSGPVTLENATQTDRDLSRALTVYPSDLTQVPPQDLEASVSWHVNKLPIQPPILKAPKTARTQVPAVSVPLSSSFAAQQPSAAGTVERGDYLSRMLRQKNFGFLAIVVGLLAAFGLGAMHALSPGHGKTIVAAYLVGSRGTLKHAGILGLTVTFTHTISVFILGIGVLFFQRYFIPERIVSLLGAVSGLSIVAIGAYLLYKRTLALTLNVDVAGPVGGHDVRRKLSHSHHSHGHGHSHSHAFADTHTHGGLRHTHAVPDRITIGSLLGLGISGGLVPCPSALILLLSAISLGQVALGLGLLGAFSAGLAIVLIAVGALVVYGKTFLPKSSRVTNHPALRLLPVFSSVVVIVLGLLMTLTATGIIRPIRLLT